MTETIVLLEYDHIRIDLLGQLDERGHFAKIRALHDECENEADGLLRVQKEIAAHRLHAASKPVTTKRARPAHLANDAQILSNHVPSPGPPHVLVGFLCRRVD